MTMHPPLYEPIPQMSDASLYKVSSALQHAVDVAVSLGLPLLLTGEPGCGKTQLGNLLLLPHRDAQGT